MSQVRASNMKNRVLRYLLAFLLVSFIIPLSSCSREVTVENVEIEFWVSGDGGETYTQGDFIFRGWYTPVYMMLRVKIDTDGRRATFPSVTFIIYNSETIDVWHSRFYGQ